MARFNSGNKRREFSIVVRPSFKRVTPQGTPLQASAPLRVEFRNHFWDSDSSSARHMYENYAREQTAAGIRMTADDVQKLVEAFLEAHPDYGMVDGTGIFHEDHNERRRVMKHRLAVPHDVGPVDFENAAQCTAIIPIPDGPSEICGQPVGPGGQYCLTCDPDQEPALVS